MWYQDSEHYLQDNMGYRNMPNNFKAPAYNYVNDYYPRIFSGNEDLNYMYPETYKIIYPMVCKICNQNVNRNITQEVLEEMTMEIYNNVEDTSYKNQTIKPELKNGDVRNPNAKENMIKQDSKNDNFLMKDLIKILLLNELRKPSRQIRQRRYDFYPMEMNPYMMMGGGYY